MLPGKASGNLAPVPKFVGVDPRVHPFLTSNPAFGVASRPRSVHFPEGLGYRIWEEIAPPEKDLGGLLRRPSLDCPQHRRGLPGVALLRVGGSVGSSAL